MTEGGKQNNPGKHKRDGTWAIVAGSSSEPYLGASQKRGSCWSANGTEAAVHASTAPGYT